jgi:hypothetical protein
MLGRNQDRRDKRTADDTHKDDLSVPRASIQYRLKAWRAFQRALDPLAAPKPLRPPQQK